MANFFYRIANFFTQGPVLLAAFQLTPRYMSGIHCSPKERKVKHHFILPLKQGVIEPSFDKKNIKDPSYLEEKIREGMDRLHLAKKDIGLLVPELCLKVFVLSFDSLPLSPKEKDKIILWRLKKQMPHFPDDARFSFKIIKQNKQEKVIVGLAKASLVREYEDLFSHLHLKVKSVSIPTLSLYNLVDWENEGDAIVANIEEDHISLMAIIDSEVSLYRLKMSSLDPRSEILVPQKMDNIIKEVENTIHFIEDREKKKVGCLWVRLGFLETEADIGSRLAGNFSLPVVQIESSMAFDLNLKEKQMLSPLIGQVLWKSQKD